MYAFLVGGGGGGLGWGSLPPCKKWVWDILSGFGKVEGTLAKAP